MELDPRVRRTRIMLQQALAALMQEKDFDRISISEIAERATLNRATFYDHYPDKHALLQCMVGQRFTDLVEKRGIIFSGCEGAIKGIALGVCDYLAEMEPSLRNSEKPIETAIVSVVRGMMLDGLRRHTPAPGIPLEMVASSMAWAIYGAGHEWIRTPNRMPADEAATTINRLLAPVLISLA